MKKNIKKKYASLPVYIIVVVVSIVITAYMSYSILSDRLKHNSSIFRTSAALNTLEDIKQENYSNIEFRESLHFFSMILDIDENNLEDYQPLCSNLTNDLNSEIITIIENKTAIPINQQILFNNNYIKLKKLCEQ